MAADWAPASSGARSANLPGTESRSHQRINIESVPVLLVVLLSTDVVDTWLVAVNVPARQGAKK